MVKYTQTIRGQIADELFECVCSFCVMFREEYGEGLFAWNGLTVYSIVSDLIRLILLG